MLRSTVFSVLFLAAALCVSAGAPATYHHHHSIDFIRGACQATRYPLLCEQSLSSYAPVVRRSPRQLARAALSVSIDRAKSASLFARRMSAGTKIVGRSRDAASGAVRDCTETLADGADRLQRSLDEMRRMGRARSARFAWHLSNVQTWVSAALTDQSTCFDELSPKRGGGSPAVRAAIRKKVAEVAQVTSNALALVNQLVLLRRKN